MNNSNENAIPAWTVETRDLTEAVHAAIQNEEEPLALVFSELSKLTREIAQATESNRMLHAEILRLRADLATQKLVRLSPFSAAETLSRLS